MYLLYIPILCTSLAILWVQKRQWCKSAIDKRAKCASDWIARRRIPLRKKKQVFGAYFIYRWLDLLLQWNWWWGTLMDWKPKLAALTNINKGLNLKSRGWITTKVWGATKHRHCSLRRTIRNLQLFRGNKKRICSSWRNSKLWDQKLIQI